MNRDPLDSNIFRRAIHPPKDTYEPYNPPDKDAEAEDFDKRPVAPDFKPKKKKKSKFDVYDTKKRGF